MSTKSRFVEGKYIFQPFHYEFRSWDFGNETMAQYLRAIRKGMKQKLERHIYQTMMLYLRRTHRPGRETQAKVQQMSQILKIDFDGHGGSA